tara:strand:+ start:4846 stop:5826 length:981 start_codon:yes stop_codon:yes gene_type:complete
MTEEAQTITSDEELASVNTVEVPIPDVEIDIIDDRPLEDQKPPRQVNADDNVDDEIEGIGERTKKRIDKLKYDYHEEKRRADAAQKVRDESVGITRQLHEENQKLKATVAKSEDALINSLKTKTSTEIESAKAEYKTAYEAGDTDRMLNAQEKLSSAIADKSYVENYVPTMPQTNGQQAQQYQQPQQEYQPQQPVYQQPAPDQAIDPAAAEYIRNNPWFERAGDEDMTALAYGMHAKLVREGIDPIRDSEIYYTKVDAAMKERFPERFEETTASSQRPSTVVAPANRTGTKQRRVQLTKTQVDLARRLGLTPEQYATQYAKELNNG